MPTWTRWVARVMGQSNSVLRRKPRGPVLAQIEGLETRTVLAAPTASNGAAMIAEDTILAGNAVGQDLDGDALTFSKVADPQHGSLTFDSNGAFTYTPNLNYTGPDSFTFKVTAGGQDSNTATFNISVTSVSDAPTAISGSRKLNVDTVLNGSLTGLVTDPDSNSFTFELVDPATDGNVVINPNGTFTYTPNPGASGPDSFSFKVTDSTLLESNVAVISLSVVQNNAPTVDPGFGNPNEDVAFPGTVATLADDADGDPLTFSVIVQPQHGTLNFNSNGTFTYTPAANYSGMDSFSYRASDGIFTSNVGVFTFNVSPIDDPLVLSLPSPTPQVPRNSVPVRIDPAASLVDNDTATNFANTRIRVVITGNSNGDNEKGRVNLVVLGQANAPGTIRLKKGQIFYGDGNNDISVATYSGGTVGRSLIIQFRSKPEVTAEVVNLVLKQISVVASKKASTFDANGDPRGRSVGFTIDVGNQRLGASKDLNVI